LRSGAPARYFWDYAHRLPVEKTTVPEEGAKTRGAEPIAVIVAVKLYYSLYEGLVLWRKAW
jgi:hypothetical protein